MPQDRDGTFSPDLCARYQRSEQALVTTLSELYLQGVSTRKVAAITAELGGTQVAQSPVSALVGRVEPELAAWRERRLSVAAEPYLIVDARYEPARVDGRVVSLGVLVVAGVRAAGRRAIRAVAETDTASEAAEQERFKRLKERGLRGVELVRRADHRGLKAAIERHLQGASWQRGQVHFTRNLCGMVALKHRARLAEARRGVFGAAALTGKRVIPWSRPSSTRRSRRVWPATTSRPRTGPGCGPRTVGNGVPPGSNQELTRRTRVVRILPNRASVTRLVTALALEQSEEWRSGRRHLNMEPLWEERLRPAAPAPMAYAAD